MDNEYKEMMRVLYEEWSSLQGTPQALAWPVSPVMIGAMDWYAYLNGITPGMTEFSQALKDKWMV